MDVSSMELGIRLSFVKTTPLIVTDVGGAVNNTGVYIWTHDGGFRKKQPKTDKK
jgi:hypothetical protein